MPLYEYECADCHKRFEIRQRVTEDPITVCPTCGGPTKRVLYPAGIIFKGSGWYITDNRKSDSASTSSSSTEKSSEKNGTDSKSETKTDGAKTEKSSSTSSTKTESTAKSSSTASPAS